MADGRFSLSVMELQGADLMASERVARLRHLDEDENWRRTISLGYQVLETDLVGLGFNAGYSDLDLPYTRGQAMSIGRFSTWEHNRVADMGVDIRLLDGRIALQSSYFWSDNRTRRDDDLHSGLVDSRHSGSAQWHNIEADLLRGDDLSLSVYGLYRDIDPEFVSLRDKRVSVYSAEGKKLRLGGHSVLTTDRATAREKAKSFKTGTYWEHGRETTGGAFGEVGSVLDLGRLELSGHANTQTEYRSGELTEDQEETRLRARYSFSPVTLSGWTEREATATGRSDKFAGQLNLSIRQLFEDAYDRSRNPFAGLLPTDIYLHGSRQEEDNLQTEAPARIDRELGVGLDWETDNSATNVSVSSHFSENARPSPEPDAGSDVSVDFSHTVFGDHWDITAYGAGNVSRYQIGGSETQDAYLGAGVSLWLEFTRLPDFVASLDFNEFSSQGSDGDSLYRDWFAKLSLDFSDQLVTITKDRHAFARVTYKAQSVTTAETGADRDRAFDHAAILSYARRF